MRTSKDGPVSLLATLTRATTVLLNASAPVNGSSLCVQLVERVESPSTIQGKRGLEQAGCVDVMEQ